MTIILTILDVSYMPFVYGLVVLTIGLLFVGLSKRGCKLIVETIKALFACTLLIMMVSSALSNNWLMARLGGAFSQYSSFSTDTFSGLVEINFGHRNMNISLNGDVTSPFSNHFHVFFNERFALSSLGRLRADANRVRYQGIPSPVRQVLDYLTCDFGDLRLARQLRLAGIASAIMIWSGVSSFVLCSIMSFLVLELAVFFGLLSAALTFGSTWPYMKIASSQNQLSFRFHLVDWLDNHYLEFYEGATGPKFITFQIGSASVVAIICSVILVLLSIVVLIAHKLTPHPIHWLFLERRGSLPETFPRPDYLAKMPNLSSNVEDAREPRLQPIYDNHYFASHPTHHDRLFSDNIEVFSLKSDRCSILSDHETDNSGLTFTSIPNDGVSILNVSALVGKDPTSTPVPSDDFPVNAQQHSVMQQKPATAITPPAIVITCADDDGD